MDIYEARTQSFVVKLWLEEANVAGEVTWRGYVTHVPSGARRYVTDYAGLAAFLAQHLDDTRRALGMRWSSTS